MTEQIKATSNSKKLQETIKEAINNFMDSHADCTSNDVQLALRTLMEEYQ